MRAEIIGPQKLPGGSEGGEIDWNAYALRLLAEGDSWFSLGSIPAHDLPMELRFDRRALVFDLAYPGDAVNALFRPMRDCGAEFAQMPKMRSTWRRDTRNTLIRAAADVDCESNEWENEIHPNAGGYRELAAKVAAEVLRRVR